MTNSQFTFTTRIAFFMLAIGFFYSCSSPKPTISDLVSQKDYSLALSELESQINRNPNDASLYYLKGQIHGYSAEEKEASARVDDYTMMQVTFDSVMVKDQSYEYASKVDSVKNRYWEIEYQEGLNLFEVNNIEESKLHFLNATIIKPNEVKSHRSLASAEYSLGNINSSINALLRALDSVENIDLSLYENLGFLYLETGNAEQSIFYYEAAREINSNNKNVNYGLVNAYISSGIQEETISLLDELIAVYSTDPLLNNIYGTELYKRTPSLLYDLKIAYSTKDTSLVNEVRSEWESLAEYAEEQLLLAYQKDTTSVDFIESLAVFYNNMVGNYLSLYDSSFDEDKAEIKERANTLIDFAIEYYIKLKSLSPEDSSINQKIQTLNSLKE